MMSATRSFSTLLLFALTSFLAGCGGSSSPSITVALTSSGTAVDQAGTINITASVANDSKNAGVQWSVSGGGSLANSTTTSVTYVAPSSVTSSFTATITGTSLSDPSKSASVQISVNPLPTISTTSLPVATAGANYSATINLTGGSSPFTWSISSGTLPPGLVLALSKTNSVTITGVATGPGSSPFTIMVKDASNATASQPLTITVNAPPALTITTTSIPGGEVGIAYSQTLQATGGVPPYTWSVAGNLPAGLTLNPSTGAISGTPTAVGTSTFTVKVTDSETPSPSSTTKSLSIAITNPPLTITTTSLPQGTINFAYSSTLTAIGGTQPYTWTISIGSLPSGLTINPSTGQISGKPTATGTVSFTVKVVDSSSTQQSATANLSITVNPALAITTATLPAGSVGSTYSTTLVATGGVIPYTWNVTSGSLPSGLSLAANTGVISGTPTTAETSSFTVTVSDAELPADSATANLSITISTASCPNNASFLGTYATVLEGWNTDSTAMASATAASFAADGAGNISNGSVETVDTTNGHRTGTFTGTYCMGSNNLGTMTLDLGAPYNTAHTFAIALNSSGANGRVMFYDTTNTKEIGPLRQQTASAFTTGSINGNYAFGLIGEDASGSRFGVAGQFDSNGLGALTGMADGDDAVTGVSSQVTLTSSDFTVASTGRGTGTLTFNGGSMNFSLDFAFYVVSSTEMLMIETDGPRSGHPLLVGRVFAQSGSFADASLGGNAIVGMQALASGAPSVTGGIVNASGNGNSISFSFDQNAGGTIGTVSGSGTYSVSSNGRVTLSGSGLGSNPPVFYLVGSNEGFVVGTDSAVTFGQFYPQSGSSFNNASLNGTFTGGSDHPETDQVSEEIDSVSANGTGGLTGTSATNVNGGSPTESSISATYSVSSKGRVVLTESGSQAAILYIVSSGQVLVIPASSGDDQPALSWWLQ
jgi:hypothetical protein